MATKVEFQVAVLVITVLLSTHATIGYYTAKYSVWGLVVGRRAAHDHEPRKYPKRPCTFMGSLGMPLWGLNLVLMGFTAADAFVLKVGLSVLQRLQVSRSLLLTGPDPEPKAKPRQHRKRCCKSGLNRWLVADVSVRSQETSPAN